MSSTPDCGIEVTVVVMTYNHARFIAQALDGALSQETDFRYEIVITEDCSTDGTREIVLDYQRRHPDRIRLALSESNWRSNAVVRRGIEAARGTYVALLDGDDFWTRPDKLERQVEFMRAHPECSMCFHNAAVVHEDGTRPPWNWTPKEQPALSTLEDIWRGNFIATCSTLFRRESLGRIPDWYDNLVPMITDWPLHILNARAGAIGYIDEVMGVYRYHSGGLYSGQTQMEKIRTNLKFYRAMNENFAFEYDALIRTAMSTYVFEWAEEYESRGERALARRCLFMSLEGRPINRHVSARRWLGAAARLCLPARRRRRAE